MAAVVRGACVLALACMCMPADALSARKKSILSKATEDLPPLPDDLHALGVKLFGSEAGLSAILSETRCSNGSINFNLSLTMCGQDRDLPGRVPGGVASSFWDEQGQTDMYGLRRPGLDPNGVFIDAGSYIGDSSLQMLKLFPHAKVYIFEVMPRSYFYMRWNLRLNNIPEIPCDGSPAGGGACAFSGPTGFGDGTPLKIRIFPDRPRSSGSALTNDKFDKFQDIEEPTVSLAQLFKQNPGFEKVEFLKLDCQGCEWSAMKNMMDAGLWSRIKTLTGEAHCVKSELPTLNKAALHERVKLYDIFKKRSGSYFLDTCSAGQKDWLKWENFDLNAEAKKSK